MPITFAGVSQGAISQAVFEAPPPAFDPTLQPPWSAFVGLQGYKTLRLKSLVSIPEPGAYPEEVFNPSSVPPKQSYVGFQGYRNLTLRSRVSLIEPGVFPDQIFNPTAQSPVVFKLSYQYYKKFQLIAVSTYLDVSDIPAPVTEIILPGQAISAQIRAVLPWWRSASQLITPSEAVLPLWIPSPRRIPNPVVLFRPRIRTPIAEILPAPSPALNLPPPIAFPGLQGYRALTLYRYVWYINQTELVYPVLLYPADFQDAIAEFQTSRPEPGNANLSGGLS